MWTILQVRQTLLSAEFGREAVRRSAPIGVRAAKAAPLESIPPSPPKSKKGPIGTLISGWMSLPWGIPDRTAVGAFLRAVTYVLGHFIVKIIVFTIVS